MVSSHFHLLRTGAGCTTLKTQKTISFTTNTLYFYPQIFLKNLKFYIHTLSTNAISSRGISKYLGSELAGGKPQKRISIKGRLVTKEFSHLKEITKIDSTTDLLKGVVLKINDDVLVNKKLKTIKALRNVVAATV